MQQLRTTEDIKQLGTILCVWAHPDDESFCCAGIMAAAIDNGQKVACLTATKGEAGVQDEKRWPAAELGNIRAAEMSAALKCIGCTHHHWLGYTDGNLNNVPIDEAVSKIAGLINEYQPDSILTFGPEGMTGHSDHCTVSSWTSQAVKLSSKKPKIYHAVHLKSAYESLKELDQKFNIFFNIDKPPLVDVEECDILFRLPDELFERKYRALEVMPSQTETMLKELSRDKIHDVFSSECFVTAK